MKQLILAVMTTMLAATMPQTDEGLQVRYRNTGNRLSLTLSQDIEATEAKMRVAGRQFALDLALDSGKPADTVVVTIDKVKASYDAHGMEQRLGTRHLTGKSFGLSIDDGGKQLKPEDPAKAMVIHLDPIGPEGFTVAGLLAGTLPVLPDKDVEVGTTWTSERKVRSLEGWAWGIGRLTSHHRVTGVDQKEGRTIVTVETDGKTRLGPVEGERSYSGDLTRTVRWSFDATNGRLVSLSMEQKTEGICELPQGQTRLKQLTRVELSPRT